MFGCTTKVGSISVGVPVIKIPDLSIEEDIEMIIQQSEENNINRENGSSSSR